MNIKDAEELYKHTLNDWRNNFVYQNAIADIKRAIEKGDDHCELMFVNKTLTDILIKEGYTVKTREELFFKFTQFF